MHQLHTQATADLFNKDLLLEIPLGETNESQRLYRYFNYAIAPLISLDVNVVVAASKVLGRIVEMGGNSFGEPFVDLRVESQIQTMTRNERGRYGAVLLLKELARHLANWFSPHIALVFEKLPLGFRDTRVCAHFHLFSGFQFNLFAIGQCSRSHRRTAFCMSRDSSFQGSGTRTRHRFKADLSP